MTVSIDAPRRIDRNTVRITFSSDLGGTPTFFIYVDGKLVSEQQHTDYIVYLSAGHSPHIMILDALDAEHIERFPGRIMAQWSDTAATDHYRLEEFISAAWVLRAKIPDLGESLFKWFTRYLEDVATHQIRLIPVGTNGNQGTAISVGILMVRFPDIPDVSYTYNSGDAKVTIAAN